MISKLFIILLSATTAFVEAKIRLEDFYDFGTAVNDQTVPVLDDGSTGLIKISTLFPFFNHQHDGLYVNNNGVISFLVQVSQFTPDAFPLSGSKRLIAPFWADVDIRNGGIIWYRETTNQTILKLATKDVRRFAPSQFRFQATWVFVATWDNVAFYGASNIGKKKRNTFQAVLITNGKHSFSMFNYNKIEWVTGTASGGDKDTGLGGTAAQGGFNAGDGINFASIPSSRTDSIINITQLSNVNIPGKFVYRIEHELIDKGGCNTQGTLTITPRYSTMLGGEALVLSGPCFTGNETVSVKFGDGPQHRCSHIPNAVSCVTQSMFTTGDIPVILSYLDTTKVSLTFHGVFTAVNPALVSPKVSRKNPREWKEKQAVSIQWDKERISSKDVKVDLMSYEKVNGKPRLVMLQNLIPNVRNAAGQANFILPSLNSVRNKYTVLLRVSETTVKNAFKSYAKQIWSDVFLLSPAEDKTLQKLCRGWLNKTHRKSLFENLQPCPCNADQAKLDSVRFHALPFCNDGNLCSSPVDCLNCLYEGEAQGCFTPNRPTPEGSTMVCCYDIKGILISAKNSRGASVAQKFPYQKSKMADNSFVPYLDNFANDVFPYEICCLEDIHSDNCRNFLSVRPPVSCKHYRPPRPAGGNGDPHFVTLDGKTFLFNGIGEYVLLEDSNQTMSVHIRTQKTTNTNGTNLRASVMTAVAIKSGDVVQVEMNQIHTAAVFINQTLLNFEDVAWIDFHGGSIHRTESNGSVTVLIRIASPQLSLMVTINKWLMNILLVVGSEALKGNLHGLLGNYNGDPSDDFKSRNGSILPANSTDQDIHYKFGQTWMTSASESIFRYPIGKNHSSYQNPGFRPSFIKLSNANITTRMKEVCGNNTDCLFDYIVTGSERMAESSQQFSEVIRKAVKAAVPVPSCGIPILKNGFWNASGWTAGSSAAATCGNKHTLRGNMNTIFCSQNGQWTLSDTKCTETSGILAFHNPVQMIILIFSILFLSAVV